MLSYNSASDPACDHTRSAAKRAHAAHAMVLGFHTICCGAPILASLLAGGALSVVGGAAFLSGVHELHDVLHHYELWILGLSAALVAVGAALEWAARRRNAPRFPVFFAVSVVCLALNAALVVSHRWPQPAGPVLAQAASPAAAAAQVAPAAAPAGHDHGHTHHHAHDHAH